MVVGERGVESEGQRWEVKESQIPKTKVHRLEGFLDSTTKVRSSMSPSFTKVVNVLEVLAAVGKSVRAAEWPEGAQEYVGQATLAKHTPFLVAHSGYSDYPLVQSSQLSDRVLAMRYTGADSDEGSSVAG